MSDEGVFDPSDMTALVVDQNHFHRRIAVDQLRAMGFDKVVGAPDSATGWDSLCTLDPDVLLLEWLDSSGDGLDFVRRIRNGHDAPNRAVSIFMLSSRGSQNDVEAARRAGVDGYMRKPISAGALQVRVKKIINNPQPFIVTANYVGPCRRRRADPTFAGPWRRLDDVPPQFEDPEDIDLKAEIAKARVAALASCASRFQPGDSRAAREVFKGARDLLQAAEQIGDLNLTFGVKEMLRYLQAQGATARLDPEVVRTHVAALQQLVHLPRTLTVERERVAHSLKRMVDKKLSRGAHG